MSHNGQNKNELKRCDSTYNRNYFKKKYPKTVKNIRVYSSRPGKLSTACIQHNKQTLLIGRERIKCIKSGHITENNEIKLREKAQSVTVRSSTKSNPCTSPTVQDTLARWEIAIYAGKTNESNTYRYKQFAYPHLK